MIFQILLLTVVTILYIFLTKNRKIKSKIILYFRAHFNGDSENIWTNFISTIYCLLPVITLVYLPSSFFKDFVILRSNVFFELCLSILGLFMSLTITTIILNVIYFYFKLDYSETNQVSWIQHVKNANFLWGVLAAVSEEFFIRLLIPLELYLQTGRERELIVFVILSSLIFTVLQLIYTDTKIQKIVIGTAAVSISGSSILLFLVSKNIFPSIMMHAFYVFIFLVQWKKKGKIKYD